MDNIQLREKIKKLSWFPDYQSFPELGIKGLRDSNERFVYFRNADFAGKTVIDYGCSLGQASIYAKKIGAIKAMGVDCQSDTIECSVEIAKELNIDATFKVINFNQNNFNQNIPSLLDSGAYKSDTALFLSVYGTNEIKNRELLLKTILDNTKNVLYFEGHNNDTLEQYSKLFLKPYFKIKNFEFKGFTRDNYYMERDNYSIRPFFIIDKNDLDYESIVKRIREIKDKKGAAIKIGVEGKSGAGKSTILSKIKNDVFGDAPVFIVDDMIGKNGQKYRAKHRRLGFLNHIIKEDIPFIDEAIEKEKNVIFSDGALRRHVKYLDILINVDCDEKVRMTRLVTRYGSLEKVPKEFINEEQVNDKNFYCDALFSLRN